MMGARDRSEAKTREEELDSQSLSTRSLWAREHAMMAG